MKLPLPRRALLFSLTLGVVTVGACAEDTASLDASAAADVGAAQDGGAVVDSGVAGDGGVVADAGVVTDSGVASDAGVAGDGGALADAGAADDTTRRAVAAAQAFLATLSASQQTAVLGDFDDASQRSHWSNFPTGIFTRTGVKLGVMTEAQADAGFALLAVLLSARGYQQVEETVAADEALRQQSSGGNLTFGRAEYFFRILGTPSETTPWMVQFGGHHLAINATIVGANVTLAPSLTGAQPASYTVDGVVQRPQGLELDAAWALLESLTSAQRADAVVGSSVIDLVLGPGQDGRTIAAEGLPGSALDASQRAALLAFVDERIGLLNDDDAAGLRARAEAELDQTYFAWFGSTTRGQAAYWRVTAPSYVFEYSPQSLGGSATNHTHAMFREIGNDYGERWR